MLQRISGRMPQTQSICKATLKLKSSMGVTSASGTLDESKVWTCSCNESTVSQFSCFKSLKKMSKQWQVVDENGELVDDDDTSSIGSDWSFMRFDNDFGSQSRSHSVSGDASLLNSPAESPQVGSRSRSTEYKRHPSLPNSMDPPIRGDPATRPSATSVRAIAGNHPITTGLLRPVTGNSTVPELRKSVSYGLEISRKVVSRSNITMHANRRHRHRNTLNVDDQHAKCLRRGPQISNAFQRRQVQLAAGGQYPQPRHGAK
ncbi:unnamed protein product [Calicophoron daubneyi]|uniref:Uncharacterized protein n=1 Tax=Calicophoron daubneyi TaxID=300641 RepID=A0AAV2TTJ5_CALDB